MATPRDYDAVSSGFESISRALLNRRLLQDQREKEERERLERVEERLRRGRTEEQMQAYRDRSLKLQEERNQTDAAYRQSLANTAKERAAQLAAGEQTKTTTQAEVDKDVQGFLAEIKSFEQPDAESKKPKTIAERLAAGYNALAKYPKALTSPVVQDMMKRVNEAAIKEASATPVSNVATPVVDPSGKPVPGNYLLNNKPLTTPQPPAKVADFDPDAAYTGPISRPPVTKGNFETAPSKNAQVLGQLQADLEGANASGDPQAIAKAQRALDNFQGLLPQREADMDPIEKALLVGLANRYGQAIQDRDAAGAQAIMEEMTKLRSKPTQPGAAPDPTDDIARLRQIIADRTKRGADSSLIKDELLTLMEARKAAPTGQAPAAAKPAASGESQTITVRTPKDVAKWYKANPTPANYERARELLKQMGVE